MMLADIPSEGFGIGFIKQPYGRIIKCILSIPGHSSNFKNKLRREACKIEIDILNRPIGKQDQYIAAYGGLKSFRFCRDNSVEVEDIIMDSEHKRKLGSNLLLFFTSTTRNAAVY